MERYLLLQEAEERELSLKSRLQRQDDLCAKLSHHPSTRNFKKRSFPFSLFPFSFLSPILSQRGKWLFAGQVVVLISVPITLPECMNRCTSCTSLARSSERLERVKYRWLSQVVCWLGSVEKCRRCYWLDFGSYLVHIGSIYVWKIFKV